MLRQRTILALTLTTRLETDVTVIDLSGRLTLGPASAALREALQALTDGGVRRILLNLKDVSFIDSAGLGELASGHANVKNKGGTLKMACLSKRVRELFQMTGLNRVLSIYENEPDAIHSWL